MASRPIAEIIKEYGPYVLEEMVNYWKTEGLGTLLDGYLRAIDPNEYIQFTRETCHDGFFVDMIPVFSTAFGDLLIWAKDEEGDWGIGILKYKEICSDYVGSDMELFFDELKNDPMAFDEPAFPEDGEEEGELEYGLYLEAVKKWGPVERDECFTYVPFLFLGGEKSVDKLKKVKMRECLYLIEQFTGGING